MMKILVFGQIREETIEENTLGVINKLANVSGITVIESALLGGDVSNELIEELGIKIQLMF